MTLARTYSSAATHPDADGTATEEGRVSPSGERRRRRIAHPAALPRRLAASALLILSVCLLAFGLWLAFGSRLHYDRTQHNAYATFRVALATGTAPTGPTYVISQGKDQGKTRLLPLGTPVAVLAIPAIGLQAVVFEGTTGHVLEGGPGHLRDTPLPGQPGTSVIMGRRATYGGPFGRLGALNPGNTVTVTTGQGVATYRVRDVRHAGETAPPPLTSGQGRLTLVTADGPPLAPSGVFYIDADLTSPVMSAAPVVLSSANLPAAEAAMGTEPLAWVPLVLWGQALAVAAGVVAWLRYVWGRWQTWLVAVPVLGYFGLAVTDEVARLLPNLL